MGTFPQSFEVYGFTIEVHSGGRRVWPPSFKRFVKDKLDNGELTVHDVMEECNASQSLVYKWRADVKASKVRMTSVREERFFSEVVIDKTEPSQTSQRDPSNILLRGREIEIALPSTYPVDDLVKIIISLEARA
jgi:transposase-like protein